MTYNVFSGKLNPTHFTSLHVFDNSRLNLNSPTTSISPTPSVTIGRIYVRLQCDLKLTDYISRET